MHVKLYVTLALCLTVAACSTQRYGRAMPVSETERQTLNCREIQIEAAKTEEFLYDVRRTRKDTNAAHVLGFLGDFGIGNVMEGDAAELSGETRLKSLRDLKQAKGCS